MNTSDLAESLSYGGIIQAGIIQAERQAARKRRVTSGVVHWQFRCTQSLSVFMLGRQHTGRRLRISAHLFSCLTKKEA